MHFGEVKCWDAKQPDTTGWPCKAVKQIADLFSLLLTGCTLKSRDKDNYIDISFCNGSKTISTVCTKIFELLKLAFLSIAREDFKYLQILVICGQLWSPTPTITGGPLYLKDG